jgi:hypothetical protein
VLLEEADSKPRNFGLHLSAIDPRIDPIASNVGNLLSKPITLYGRHFTFKF